MIRLGDRVRDRISGLTGIVIGYHYWLYGCERVTVQPEETKDGKMAESASLDAAQCEVIQASVITGYTPPKGVVDSRDVAARPAGPRPDPSRGSVAQR